MADSGEDTEQSKRPGTGVKGDPYGVLANHYKIEAKQNIHHYSVSISPPVDSQFYKRIMEELELMLGFKRIDRRRGGFYTSTVVDDSNKFNVETENNELFIVTLQYESTVNLVDTDTDPDESQRGDIRIPLGPLLDKSLGDGFIFSDRGVFPQEYKELEGALMHRNGFTRSIRRSQMGISLNLDTCSSVFSPVSEFVKDYLKVINDSTPDWKKLEKILKGMTVMVTYGSNMTYKVEGLSDEPTSQLEFNAEDGVRKSVVEYYQTRYQINLTHTSWPALKCLSTTSRKVLLPLEVCQTTKVKHLVETLDQGGQFHSRSTIRFRKPKHRQKSIQETVHYFDQSICADFGLEVKTKMTSIAARVLPAPSLLFGDNEEVTPDLGSWQDDWKSDRLMLNCGAVLQHWALLNFSQSLQVVDALRFMDLLFENCRERGMVVETIPMTIMYVPKDHLEGDAYTAVDIQRFLSEIHNNCATTQAGKKLQLLFVVLPDCKGHYGTIKKECETKLGIISQCLEPHNVRKLLKNATEVQRTEFLDSLVLKINVKLGGVNFVVKDVATVTAQPTIIFGADLSDGVGTDGLCSTIAAVVSSPSTSTTYRATFSRQESCTEIIHNLSAMVEEHLVAFNHSTGDSARRIFFFRDGISQSKFKELLSFELEAIKDACKRVGVVCQICFVVAVKRHHTRLFIPRGNICAGTVVDTQICHPNKFDFYICSHEGIRGTARPVHYHVIHDDTGISADDIQTLINSLCYVCTRSTSAVSLVGPVYYADLAASRARHFLHADGHLASLHPSLEDIMFYI